MNQSPIIGIGEILWDLHDDRPRPGGAPFNFAFHCHQMGHPAIIVSRLGTDEAGERLRARVREMGMSDEFIQADPDHPTGSVQVEKLENGQHRFTITENVAWDYLQSDDRFDALYRSAKAVCYGTLAQRSPTSRQTIQRFVDAARQHTWTVCDVNLRPPLTEPAVLRHAVERVPVLKMNEDELIEIAARLNFPNPREFLRSLFSFRTLIVCITLGERGCRLLSADGTDEIIPGFPTNVVDTVGAGDAFMAGFLVAWREGKPLGQAARFANALASLVASRPGGTPKVDRAEVERLC